MLHSGKSAGDVRSVGVVLQTQWCFFLFFSSVLPVQGQTGCVRHSPSGSVFVCTLEGCHPPSASHLRTRRRNLNLADRRRARTARSSFFFLSFSLCAATYTHISLSVIMTHLHFHLNIKKHKSKMYSISHFKKLQIDFIFAGIRWRLHFNYGGLIVNVAKCMDLALTGWLCNQSQSGC